MQGLLTRNDACSLWIGLGCRRGTAQESIADAVMSVCQRYKVDLAAIAGLATLATKVNEPGLLAFSHSQHWPILYFAAQHLQNSSVPSPSNIVALAIGSPSVAEAAALTAAAQASVEGQRPILWVPKQVLGNVTLAIAKANGSAYVL
jgi:cobalt-precorrin 5A hydrolase/precorrin-3B C17-methyltransferase